MENAYRKKYLFYIAYRDGITASAASKPITDTAQTLASLGYEDCSLTFAANKKTLSYYLIVFLKFIRFFFKIKNGSIVATQYPIATVGRFFTYFIRIAALRNIKFITLIHDINILRSTKPNNAELRKELKMLGSYDGIIAHNDVMDQWLFDNGLKKSIKTVPLNFFDYISANQLLKHTITSSKYEIAFAGHLSKSLFIYKLNHVKKWRFNIYGAGFESKRSENINTTWKGEFSPEEIVYNLTGSWGLVWDGVDSSKIETNRFGNYMRYNNPFKFSLYLAAGLPVIAPKTAAIANTIIKHNIGFVIDALDDLNDMEISDESYEAMRSNVKAIQKDIIAGNFLRTAVQNLEHLIKADA